MGLEIVLPNISETARDGTPLNYLIGPYNAGPKSALFLRVAEIRAGVKRAGVKRAVFWLENSKKRR